MRNFVFHNPTKLLFGTDTIKATGEEIGSFDVKKVLMVAGGGSIRENGVYNACMSSLKEAGIDAVEFWGVRPNPTLSHVREGIEKARAENVDGILAVGGGSVIDTAKAIAAGVKMDDIWNAFEDRSPVADALPLFAVLTLSATGSEMNAFAVITNEDERKKWAFGGPGVFPKVSIIDPNVQMSLPWNQTANGAVDAMAHIQEFQFLGGEEAETSLAINEALLRTIIESTDVLQKSPNDYAARANLAWCATMALNGISGIALAGGEWTVHTLEHAISALHPKVAHAEGLAVMFPAWMQYVHDAHPDRFERYAKNVWGAGSFDEALETMRAKYKEWEMPTTLGDIGIGESDIPALVDNVMQMGRSHGRVRKLERPDIEAVYKLAL